MMKRDTWTCLWNLVCGSMDALTGLLLVFAPALVLGLLGIEVPASALVFLSWMGVFIGSVGLCYGLALLRRDWIEPVWWFTGTVRLWVAVFVTAKILQGALDGLWMTVALADFVVAMAQFAALAAGWAKGGPQ